MTKSQSILLLLIFILSNGTIQAQTTDEPKSLPRATRDERFPAVAIEAFFDAWRERNMELHSVMILKNGKVVYERWLGDNKPDPKRSYSVFLS